MKQLASVEATRKNSQQLVQAWYVSVLAEWMHFVGSEKQLLMMIFFLNENTLFQCNLIFVMSKSCYSAHTCP